MLVRKGGRGQQISDCDEPRRVGASDILRVLLVLEFSHGSQLRSDVRRDFDPVLRGLSEIAS